MFRAIMLIFSPETVWEKLLLKKPHWTVGFFLHLLPIVFITSAVEGYSLVKFGERRGEFGYLFHIPQDLALRYAVAQLLFAIIVVLVAAKLVQWIAQSFSNRADYGSSLVALAYGLSPFYFVRILDAVPALNTWLCYAIALIATLPSLYHGIPRMLTLEQTKAFGVYLSSVLVVACLTGLAQVVAVSILNGTIKF